MVKSCTDLYHSGIKMREKITLDIVLDVAGTVSGYLSLLKYHIGSQHSQCPKKISSKPAEGEGCHGTG